MSWTVKNDDLVLRKYQHDAAMAAIRRFVDGHNQVALVLPTGAGKSAIATYVAQCLARGPFSLIDYALVTTPFLQLPH